MGELSDFNVTAAKDVAAKSLNSSAMSEDSQYSLYLFGMPMQGVDDGIIAFHNAQTEELKSKLTIVASLGYSESPVPGWPASEWKWHLRGKHLLHPDRFHDDQPILSQLNETVQVLDGALRGRLDFTAFKSRLDRIGLPLDWRNHLVNEVFRHAEVPPPKPSASVTSAPDPLASILDQIASPGEGNQGTAAQAFIQEVGSDTTGFTLDKTAASHLLDAFQAFRKHMQAHAEKAGLDILFGWGAGLAALMKGLRGRARQVGWLVAPSAQPENLQSALIGHQGSVEALTLIGFTSWEDIENSAYKVLLPRAEVILVQVEPESVDTIRTSVLATEFASKVFLMQGKVRCAFGNDLCALKPAALAYIEACLKSGLKPVAAKEDGLTLEDQDPCPGRSERHVAEVLLSETEWVARCRTGVNQLNGKLGSAHILFRPLTAVGSAK